MATLSGFPLCMSNSNVHKECTWYISIWDASIEYGNNVIQYTEEQLKQKATEAVKDSALKAELDAQKLAQNALDNAKKEFSILV